MVRSKATPLLVPVAVTRTAQSPMLAGPLRGTRALYCPLPSEVPEN
jgi:hypothetical protein